MRHGVHAVHRSEPRVTLTNSPAAPLLLPVSLSDPSTGCRPHAFLPSLVPPPPVQYCLNLSAPFICEVPPFKQTLTDLMPYVDYLFGNGERAGEACGGG